MDSEGSLSDKMVRLNQLLPPPDISLYNSADRVKYSTDNGIALDTLHGWAGVVALMQRDAIVRIQRRYRLRWAKLMRSRDIILTALRGKIDRMRKRRKRELDSVKDKFCVAKYFLVGLIYLVIAFLTVMCILMQLLIGIYFDFETELRWVQAYWLAMFIETVPLSFTKIIFSWLLPKFWLWGFVIVLGGSVVWFGTQCEEILTDRMHQIYVCETLPF